MKILEHPEQFMEGVRILMRVYRTKDGGKGNVDRQSKKLVSRNPDEFAKNFQTLMDDIKPGERIYSTVDKRDTSKAIRTFKQLQLDNDYAQDPVDFYVDISNRWISSLQQPSARATSLFLWDCDTPEQYDQMQSILYGVEAAALVHRYTTKNGGHIITAPFQYPKLINSELHSLLHKNGMMLWAY